MARSGPQPTLKPRAGDASARPKRRYDFGTGGLLYILVTLLVALGAFNSQNNLLYWSFGFALALLLVSGVLSGAMLMGLRVERAWISPAVEGETVRIRYLVRNINRLVPTFAITITEEGFEAAAPTRRPWYLRVLRPAPTSSIQSARLRRPRTFVAHVGAGETLHIESRAVALARGPVEFPGFVVSTSFPFGLMGKRIHLSRHAATVIVPRPELVEIDPAGVSSRTGRHGGNARRAGLGEEFFALREYTHGDSPRDVAWRASARRGALLVRQFAASSPQRLWIVLRLRARPGAATADERAIRIAAGLAQQAEQRGVEYGLAVPLTRLLVHPRRGEGHLARLMTDLGLLELGPDDGRGSRVAFPPQAAHGGAGSTCVVVHGGEADHGFAPSSPGIVTIVATETGVPPAHHAGPALAQKGAASAA